MDINNVVLIGRLTRDCEVRYSSSGLPICEFSIAVNRRKKEGESWVDEVSFFSIVLFGRQGEALQQYLQKGKQVSIQGELRQDRWEQDGQKRSKIQVIAHYVQLLGGKGDSGFSQSSSPSPSSSTAAPATGSPTQTDFDDDIPF